MRLRVIALALLSLAFCGHAQANCSGFPYTFSNGTLADANQVMSNFNNLLNCMNSASITQLGTVTVGTWQATAVATAFGGTNKNSWTLGSIPYLSSTSQFSEDNSSLFYDGVNHRLGLGTTAPEAALQIPGGTAATGILIGNPGGITLASGLRIYGGGGSPNDAGIMAWGDGSGHNLRFALATTGALTTALIDDKGDLGGQSLNSVTPSTGGSTTLCVVANQYINGYSGVTQCSSDSRLKHNIVPIADSATDKIRAMAPVDYAWNFDAASAAHAGFIAQDIKALIPEAVFQQPDGYYTLEYQAITAYTVKALQEIDARLTAHGM